jgi:hypothetical protein
MQSLGPASQTAELTLIATEAPRIDGARDGDVICSRNPCCEPLAPPASADRWSFLFGVVRGAIVQRGCHARLRARRKR